MKLALLLVALIVLGGMAWIRLAPSDPARWNVLSPTPDDPEGWVLYPPGIDLVEESPGGARASLTLFDVSPQEALARLDGIALVTPRTTRLAGSPGEGMITWITRTAVFGFPDYTTAAARAEGPATRLYLHARQRFGHTDIGVNAARLRGWIGRLAS